MKRDIGVYKLGSKWKFKNYENLGYLTIVSLYYHENIFKAELIYRNPDGFPSVKTYTTTSDSDLLEQEDLREKSLNAATEYMKDPDNVKRIREFFDSKITFQARQRNRVYRIVKDLNNDEFYDLVKKFLIWETKFRNFNFDVNQKIKNSHIFNAFISVVENYRENDYCDLREEDSINYKEIIIKISSGLGFNHYEISKDKEILFIS